MSRIIIIFACGVTYTIVKQYCLPQLFDILSGIM